MTKQWAATAATVFRPDSWKLVKFVSKKSAIASVGRARLSAATSAESLLVSRCKTWLLVLLGVAVCFSSSACIWDAETLEAEVKRSPKIADVISGAVQKKDNPARLEEKITDLLQKRREDDPIWWNDLAGAYLRLGKADEAATLLEPVVQKFENDYGIHANLGTAYHLLGRYEDAAREIARDLEINPNAHFGLERYHLALLQYLSKDLEYQKNHLYLDEWTDHFATEPAEYFHEQSRLEVDAAAERKREAGQWSAPLVDHCNLGAHPKWEEGVIYMATLNPNQPACFTMLGIVCLTKRDFNLAVAAFEKAIALGSPQKELIEEKVEQARKFISNSHANSGRGAARSRPASVMSATFLFLVSVGVLVAGVVLLRVVRGLKG